MSKYRTDTDDITTRSICLGQANAPTSLPLAAACKVPECEDRIDHEEK